MRRILLDENAPVGLKAVLGGHNVHTAPEMGWAGLSNGRLLDAAEASRFEVMVTADQNIRAQQNLAGPKIALVVLATNHWLTIRANTTAIVDACAAATPGSYTVVSFPNRTRHPDEGPAVS